MLFLLPTLVTLTQAGVQYERLRTFGTAEGESPYAGLVEGSDGGLYGTTYSGGNGSYAGTVFRVGKDGNGYRILHFFGRPGDGKNPESALLKGSDGVLYGTTSGGGSSDAGTIFRLNEDGTGYSILRRFGGGDGQKPQAALVEAEDGALYGTVASGGDINMGIVFRINRDGSGYRVLHSFEGVGDGRNPRAALVPGSHGTLFGTTAAGGERAGGTVFSVKTDGSEYRVLHSFGGDGEGKTPIADLVQGKDGVLYGTTSEGGDNNAGTVFKLNVDGSGYAVLHDFGAGENGAKPLAGLTLEGDGRLYGTTSQVGSPFSGNLQPGTVFGLNTDGRGFTILHNFEADQRDPRSKLLTGTDGILYGTTGAYPGTVFKLNADGSGYGLVHRFAPGQGDGQNPRGLVRGSDGGLYGTTEEGGVNGQGTIFKLAGGGSGYSILHSFGDGDDRTGAGIPNAIIEGKDGALYGTTKYEDTVFKLNKDGTGYRVLHVFAGGVSDGELPVDTLFEGSDGSLYGMTWVGGSGKCTDSGGNPVGCGTLFKLNKDGSGYAILHSFQGARAGDGHLGGTLAEGSDGLLYGTTLNGGVNVAGSYLNRGFGTIFKINKDGSGYGVLRSFDGESPGVLILGIDGALYGGTYAGTTNTSGTIFKFQNGGSDFTVLHRFGENGGASTLFEAPSGELYGTSFSGGAEANFGTIFRINKDGSKFEVLYRLGSNVGDGPDPRAFVMGRDGAFYGITAFGGDLDFGTAFRLWRPETPDVIVGSGPDQIIILGAGGQRYEVLQSTDLRAWVVLETITMPNSGSHAITVTVPAVGQAFYRATWLP